MESITGIEEIPSEDPALSEDEEQPLTDIRFRASVRGWNTDYSMYSMFLTTSPGSVLFSRSNLLKRKDLCFPCLTLGLIRHRRSKKPHTFSQSTRHDFSGDTSRPPTRSLVYALWRLLSLRLYSPFLKVPLIYH